MRIAITGGTGLIGKRISRILLSRGDKVTIVTRNPDKAKQIFAEADTFFKWDSESVTKELSNLLKNQDALIHLAGENIFAKRWNAGHKNKIYNSRVYSTKALVNSLQNGNSNLKTFISASAIGYYGLSSDLPVDEYSAPGTDFLAGVVTDWENALSKAELANIRKVNIRTGIVLDTSEGALSKMLTPFKLFAGGPLGSGKQYFPWIHIDDAASLFVYALDNDSLSGAYNGTAPESINMKEFCLYLGRQIKRPSFLNVPGFALKLLYGEGAGYLLNGVNVIPRRTLESGFKFQYITAAEALNNLL